MQMRWKDLMRLHSYYRKMLSIKESGGVIIGICRCSTDLVVVCFLDTIYLTKFMGMM